MDFDLRQGLHDLGHAPGVREATVPADSLIVRAHRRRTVRTATYSAVGAGAATALVVGGMAGLQHQRRTVDPVVTPTPSPSTTARPTPTATPTPTPTATPSESPVPDAWAPAWDRCGLDLGMEDVVYQDLGIWLESLGTAQADPGEPVGVTTRLVTDGPDQAVTVRVVDALAVQWAATDGSLSPGTVVGVSRAATAPMREGVATTDERALQLPTEMSLLACDAGAAEGSGAGLAEGYYDLLLNVEITTADGSQHSQWGWAPVVIGDPPPEEPVATTPQTGDASASTHDRSAIMTSVGFPRCGQPYYPADTSTGWFSVTGTARIDGSTVTAAVTSTNTGDYFTFPDDPLPAGYIAYGGAVDAFLTVTRDGIVVAQSSEAPVTPFLLVDWWPGNSITREVSLPAVACTQLDPTTPVGAPLPPGQYEVWGWQEVGRNGGDDLAWAFYGGPWPLTIP